MHRCLCIHEVLLNIISFCKEGDDAKDIDLLNLALTCRAFYEPAMDALWYTLAVGIGPLLLLLPDNVCTRCGGDTRDYFEVRPTMPSDVKSADHE